MAAPGTPVFDAVESPSALPKQSPQAASPSSPRRVVSTEFLVERLGVGRSQALAAALQSAAMLLADDDSQAALRALTLSAETFIRGPEPAEPEPAARQLPFGGDDDAPESAVVQMRHEMERGFEERLERRLDEQRADFQEQLAAVRAQAREGARASVRPPAKPSRSVSAPSTDADAEAEEMSAQRRARWREAAAKGLRLKDLEAERVADLSRDDLLPPRGRKADDDWLGAEVDAWREQRALKGAAHSRILSLAEPHGSQKHSEISQQAKINAQLSMMEEALEEECKERRETRPRRKAEKWSAESESPSWAAAAGWEEKRTAEPGLSEQQALRRQKSADERNHRAKAHKARRSWEKQVRKAEHLGYVDSPRRREKSVDAESPALSARARGDSDVDRWARAAREAKKHTQKDALALELKRQRQAEREAYNLALNRQTSL